MRTTEKANERKRNYLIEFYTDNEKHTKAFEEIQKNNKCAWILHDKDLKENVEELKKEHIHLIVEFKEAKTISAIAKSLNIEERFIEPIRNLQLMYEYLIHLNDEDKYRYEIEEIKGNNKDKAIEIIQKKAVPDEKKLNDFYDFLEDNLNQLSKIKDYWKICHKMLGTKIVSKNQLVLKSIWDEEHKKRD